MSSSKKNAAGCGNIRKKTVTRGGKEYTYWEARYTAGYDPGTGRQIQRSITGKTQKEVSQKLKAATTAIDEGTYTAPSKMTVAQWLDIWTEEYCVWLVSCLNAVQQLASSFYDEKPFLAPCLGFFLKF